MSQRDTLLAVEAALLDSEDSPDVEILAALCAVVRFARNECDATDFGLEALLREACADPRSGAP